MSRTHEPPRRRLTLALAWRQWIRPIATVVLVVAGVRSAVADWHDVPTGSMEPTIIAGDRIVVNKLAYDLRVPLVGWTLARWADPAPGDVVICSAPDDGTRLVKRVAAVPGDRVAMRGGRLVINGEAVDLRPSSALAPTATPLLGPRQVVRERLGNDEHVIQLMPSRPANRDFAERTVPPGQYLVLGDNRDRSRDSRSFGLVPRDDVAGQVVGIAFSLEPGRILAPRPHRFGHAVE